MNRHLILVWIISVLLVACGGGGGSGSSGGGSSGNGGDISDGSGDGGGSGDGSGDVGSTSYTVSTALEAGIVLQPQSASVTEGDTATFAVDIQSGYALDNIAGCGGDYDAGAGVYTTGPVTQDCTISGSASSVSETLSVNLAAHTITASQPSIVTMVQRVSDRLTGEPVTSLTVGDFEVLEDGQPIARREAFLDMEPIDDLPYQLKTVLMLDVSSSLTQTDIANVKAAAEQIADNLLERQEIAVYVFDDTVREVIGFSRDVGAIKAAIDSITLGGPSTNLFGAVVDGFGRWSNSFSLDGITHGALVLITDGNDTSGLSSLQSALAAKEDRDFFALIVGGAVNTDPLVQLVLGQELDSVTEADRTLASRRLLSVDDFGQIDGGLQQVASEVERMTEGLYFLHYATPKRSGIHTVEVSIVDNSACLSQEEVCTTSLTGQFSANGFYNVQPELLLSYPEKTLMPGESYELSARVRWANPPFSFTWDLDNIDGQMTLGVDPLDSSKAVLSMSSDTLVSKGVVGLEVVEIPGLHENMTFVSSSIPLHYGGQLVDGPIPLKAGEAVTLEAANPCGQCYWSLDGWGIAQLSASSGQSVQIEAGHLTGSTALTVEDRTTGLSATYLVSSGFYVGVETDHRIALGGNHSAVIRPDGSLWAWGSNHYGQLGLSDNVDRSSPVRVGVAEDWLRLSSLNDHALAVKADGSLWAWGWNRDGQLGLGHTSDRNVPTRIGSRNDWQDVDAGQLFSLAIRKDGSLWAWGENWYGQLGLGDNVDYLDPARVGSGFDWVAVEASERFSLGVKRDGTLWAWGANYSSQLGVGDSSNRNSPVQVGVDGNWSAVSPGRFHVLALKEDGTLWAWGDNGAGLLGLGDTVDRSSPVQIGLDNDWVEVSASEQCSWAIKSDGTLWAWGASCFDVASNVPARVGVADDWVELVAGRHVIGVGSDGLLRAWGLNNAGQLGVGDTVDRSEPTPVPDSN